MHETSPPPNDPAGFDVSHREVTSGVALIRVQPAKHMLVGFCVSHRTLFIATPPGLVVRFDVDLGFVCREQNAATRIHRRPRPQPPFPFSSPPHPNSGKRRALTSQRLTHDLRLIVTLPDKPDTLFNPLPLASVAIQLFQVLVLASYIADV
jgi:hypothetical protein